MLQICRGLMPNDKTSYKMTNLINESQVLPLFLKTNFLFIVNEYIEDITLEMKVEINI